MSFGEGRSIETNAKENNARLSTTNTRKYPQVRPIPTAATPLAMLARMVEKAIYHPSSTRLPNVVFDHHPVVLLMSRALTERWLQQQPTDLMIELAIPVSYSILSGIARSEEIDHLCEAAIVASQE